MSRWNAGPEKDAPKGRPCTTLTAENGEYNEESERGSLPPAAGMPTGWAAVSFLGQNKNGTDVPRRGAPVPRGNRGQGLL
jgi:hypothetical protein